MVHVVALVIFVGWWLVVGCGSLERLRDEAMFLHCALASGQLSGCGAKRLGGWWPKIVPYLVGIGWRVGTP